MHAGQHYTIQEFLFWTRREIYALFGLAILSTILYSYLGCHWLALPWVPIALVGTATAFIIGFKNNASYNRLWEARQIWGSIINSSRAWGILVKDFITRGSGEKQLSEAEIDRIHQQLIHRHIAWLTALRFQLREPRNWENMTKSYNREYRDRYYTVDELKNTLVDELKELLSPDDLAYVLGKKNRATHLISLQSKQLKELAEAGLIENVRLIELENTLISFYDHQGRAERIKNFPYPRQFASINLFFVRLFVFLVPFGLLNEFEKLGEHFVWLNIPFSVLVSWVFLTMEKIGESTENPFEGNANDVPITALSRTIEIDLREMLDEKDIPPALQPVNKILM